MVGDRVANFIVMLSNATAASKKTVEVPRTEFLLSIAKTLARAGYLEILDEKKVRNGRAFIECALCFDESGKPKIHGVKRISHLGQRMYRPKKLLADRGGYIQSVVTTSKGVLTGREAKRSGVGGEVLFTIW